MRRIELRLPRRRRGVLTTTLHGRGVGPVTRTDAECSREELNSDLPMRNRACWPLHYANGPMRRIELRLSRVRRDVLTTTLHGGVLGIR